MNEQRIEEAARNLLASLNILSEGLSAEARKRLASDLTELSSSLKKGPWDDDSFEVTES